MLFESRFSRFGCQAVLAASKGRKNLRSINPAQRLQSRGVRSFRQRFRRSGPALVSGDEDLDNRVLSEFPVVLIVCPGRFFLFGDPVRENRICPTSDVATLARLPQLAAVFGDFERV